MRMPDISYSWLLWRLGIRSSQFSFVRCLRTGPLVAHGRHCRRVQTCVQANSIRLGSTSSLTDRDVIWPKWRGREKGRFTVTVINQNRFQRVFGTPWWPFTLYALMALFQRLVVPISKERRQNRYSTIILSAELPRAKVAGPTHRAAIKRLFENHFAAPTGGPCFSEFVSSVTCQRRRA